MHISLLRAPLYSVLLLLLIFQRPLVGQTTADFEDIGLPVDTFLNGSMADGEFASGNIMLPNQYNPEFNSWADWAISTKTDTLTRGFTNDFSAITGSGFAGSTTYATNFGSAFAPTIIRLTGPARGGPVTELYLTNNTYTYYSMLEGDSFAKRFGGETGDDPDFLRLTFRKYLDGELSTDSVDFYLADYRFADNSQDYIITEWTRLDLSSLGNADSLQITMTGTDSGNSGLNTPSYFCMDALTTLDRTVATREPVKSTPVIVYPNPAANWLQLPPEALLDARAIRVVDPSGRAIRSFPIEPQLDLAGIKSGIYWLQIIGKENIRVAKFVKS